VLRLLYIDSRPNIKIFPFYILYRFYLLRVLLNFSTLLLICCAYKWIAIGIQPQMSSFDACKLARTMNENFKHVAFLRERNRHSNQELREHRWFSAYWRACQQCYHRYESFALFLRGKINVSKETTISDSLRKFHCSWRRFFRQ